MSNGLGRGLNSLIPQKPKKTKLSEQEDVNIVDVSSDEDRNRVINVDIKKVEANPMQPRKSFSDISLDELMESIKEYGIIQPLIVTQKENFYELIAGERRLRAAKKAGLSQVPIILRDYDQQKQLEVALIENIQREDLNPVDTAVAYRKLIDEFNLTVQELANRVGKSRPMVSNTLRILDLPEEINEALVKGSISEAHARYLVGVEPRAKQLQIFRKILHNNLTVHETDKEIKKMGGTKNSRVKWNKTDKTKERQLREFFETKVEVKRKGKGGQIIIDFYSDEELNNIVKKLK